MLIELDTAVGVPGGLGGSFSSESFPPNFSAFFPRNLIGGPRVYY